MPSTQCSHQAGTHPAFSQQNSTGCSTKSDIGKPTQFSASASLSLWVVQICLIACLQHPGLAQIRCISPSNHSGLSSESYCRMRDTCSMHLCVSDTCVFLLHPKPIFLMLASFKRNELVILTQGSIFPTTISQTATLPGNAFWKMGEFPKQVVRGGCYSKESQNNPLGMPKFLDVPKVLLWIYAMNVHQF